MGKIQTINDLVHRGFDVEAGIELCAGDEELYLEVLEEALEEGEEKIPLIKSLYERRDYEHYLVEVHGLKNAMRSIGANHLSETAKTQEFAVKEQAYEKIDEHVEALLLEYQDVVDALRELLRS
ncbi:MAG: hypothetical protein HFI62_02380 [Lachnospiraceae bacterium]|jgi:HPt (histidine-containing phosphotransfer) domain-containing protein|nr:hypothetical protein [Lachnospiraceae bacterium]